MQKQRYPGCFPCPEATVSFFIPCQCHWIPCKTFTCIPFDLQVEQGYGGGATYDDRRGSGGVGGAGGGYRRQRYQQQRRAAPRRHFRGWGSWQPDYEQPQQPPWSGRSSQYESGEARPKKEPARFFAREEADPAAVPEAPKLNYASEVAGQDGDVERVGDTLPAPEV